MAASAGERCQGGNSMMLEDIPLAPDNPRQLRRIVALTAPSVTCLVDAAPAPLALAPITIR
jgi:hypothetical protein